MFPLNRWHAAWLAALSILTVTASGAALLRRAAPAAGPVRVTDAPPPPRTGLPARSGGVRPANGRNPLYVHVSGQVARPGLYRLPPGARVMDAITGAGGATEAANLEALNLATPVQDGQKLVVPALGDLPPRGGYLTDSPAPSAAVLVRPDPPAPPPSTAPPAWAAAAPAPSGAWDFAPNAPAGATVAKLKKPGDGVVRLNSAGEQDLQRLPGVGPSTARKILEYRAAHGGFRRVEELMEVKGIGPKKMSKMAPFLAL